MGWTCQHDFQGYCKLLHVTCTPGTKGCVLLPSDSKLMYISD